MQIFTPLTVLLFVLNSNALLYQSNNETGRLDQDVDGIESLINQKSTESTIERIERERSMPIPCGIPSERLNNGKNLKFVQC